MSQKTKCNRVESNRCYIALGCFLFTGQNCQKLQTQLTCGTSMKLGLAVEIRPRFLMVQFTNWERMSHAASADSVQLST